AILIEISPRSLVQTLLKKSLFQQYQQQELMFHSTLPITFSLTPLLTSKVTPEDYMEFFLIQLGKMYIEGLKFDSVKLFVPCVFESTIYPIPVEQTLVDTFSGFGVTFEPSLYFIKNQNDKFFNENSEENSTEIKTSIKFFPYSEFQKPCQKNSYVMVDQNENELVFNSIQPTVDSKSLINEFYDFYLTECSRYINYIISKIENPTQITTIQSCPLPLALQEQLENLTIYFQTIRKQTPIQLRLAELLEGGKLLQYLKDLSSITSCDLFESMKNFNLMIQQDLVLSQISRISVYLKNSFDLVMENLTLNDSPLRILEISTNTYEFSGDKCMTILSNQMDLNKEIKYEYVALNYSFETAKTHLKNYQVMDWNLKISSNGKFESNIPVEFNGQYDLIYLNGCLSTTMSQSTESEIKHFIQNTLEKLLKPSGFVFFSEYTSNFEFVEGLCKLEHLIQAKNVQNSKLNQQIKQLENFKKQSPFETQCKIEQQIKQLEKLLMNIGGEKFEIKLQDHFKWKQFLDGLNLYPVGLKNDSRLKSLFVYRKPVGHLNETRIVIDEFLKNEKETLGLFEKISLVLNDDKIERLWLISEKHLSPLSVQTAFINVLEGLRHQQNGHKIRCLFLNDDEKIIFDLKQLEKWTDVLDKIRKADLFMNVFQSGQWGYFRLVDIPCEIKPKFETEEKKIQELFKPDETYVLVDGLDNEFGLELTQWLVESGVKYIILTTKTSNVSEFMNTELFKKLNDLQDIYGAEIRLSSVLDLNDESECLGLVKQACKISPENKIGGLFHLGGLYEKDFTQSLFNLDKFTRCASIMSEKGYFVVFKTGLENLADKVCELRQRESDRHALVIDLDVLKGEKCFETLENMLLNNPTKKFESKIEKKIEKRQFNLMPKRVIEKLNNVEMANKVPIFVVHPIEGHVNMLRTWAEEFQVPVYGLQYTQECLRFETVEQLAQFYWQQIEIVFPNLNKFHLVGHTFGVPVAFEMALRRPQQVISLALLDSGLTQTFLNVRESTTNTTGLTGVAVSETEALYRFYQQFVAPSVRMPVEQFYQVLSTQMTTFDERVKYVVGKIVEQSQFGFDLVDLDQAVRSYIIKTNMSCKYLPAKVMPLEKILVIRPTLINGQEQTYQNILNLYQYTLSGADIDLRFVYATEKTFLEGENALVIARFIKEHNGF
ncbi:unnamed protein product, partial [Brachionus calyciflorus]